MNSFLKKFANNEIQKNMFLKIKKIVTYTNYFVISIFFYISSLPFYWIFFIV